MFDADGDEPLGVAEVLRRRGVALPDSARGAGYRKQAEAMVQSLIDRYLSGDGILRHGCSTRPSDVTLTYGDYYLVETLVSLERKSPKGAR